MTDVAEDFRTELKLKGPGLSHYESAMTLTTDAQEHRWKSLRDAGRQSFALSEKER